MRRLLQEALFLLSRRPVWLILSPWIRWEIHGRENVPPGALVVVSNHLSMMDVLVLGVAIRRPLCYMAKAELFAIPGLSLLITALGAFPVRRGKPDRTALRRAEEILSQGRVLMMFPEGTRSRSATVQEAHAGAALLALRADAPVLPVAITGTQRFGTSRRLIPVRTRVTVTIGRPFHLEPASGRDRSQHLERQTRELVRQIAALLPPAYRGEIEQGDESYVSSGHTHGQ